MERRKAGEEERRKVSRKETSTVDTKLGERGKKLKPCVDGEN
jgi:hypothetical protein